jgi:hypothetical protein
MRVDCVASSPRGRRVGIRCTSGVVDRREQARPGRRPGGMPFLTHRRQGSTRRRRAGDEARRCGDRVRCPIRSDRIGLAFPTSRPGDPGRARGRDPRTKKTIQVPEGGPRRESRSWQGRPAWERNGSRGVWSAGLEGRTLWNFRSDVEAHPASRAWNWSRLAYPIKKATNRPHFLLTLAERTSASAAPLQGLLRGISGRP